MDGEHTFPIIEIAIRFKNDPSHSDNGGARHESDRAGTGASEK